jgi:ABC-type nitrate/sulfonate/bicarbonate transport system ATPase subunit
VTSCSSAPARPLLRIDSLGVSRGGHDVLHDVNLEVAAGEVLAVLGPNGAGKSTLLETIGDVLKPSSGSIERNGRVATAMQSPDLARRTARANVELALAWWGVPRGERRGRATEALAAMQAGHLADRPASAMSGGERRRVHLARAVATSPDVLLLDEPFAGLDPVSRGELLDDTASAIRHSAGGVMLVVHDRAEAWALADRLVVLIGGRVAAEGRPRDVLDSPPDAAVARFLGFSGEVRDGEHLVLTRPTQVHLDPTGDVTATITRLVPLEEGARADLAVLNGHLSVLVPSPGPAVGDQIRVRVDGGMRYPAGPQ